MVVPSPSKANTPTVTSKSHPVRLAWVWRAPTDSCASTGRLAVSYCPGKQIGAWRRSLLDDLTRLRDHFRIDTVACLLSDAELRVRIPSLRNMCTLLAFVTPVQTKRAADPHIPHSLQSLGLRSYAGDVETAGLRFLSHPIIDMAPPACFAAAVQFISVLAEQLAAGERILLHCRRVRQLSAAFVSAQCC